MTKSIASGAKRGSVGTLILEALSTGDKYGWEIMKAIEEKSDGKYILKEPSLYSSLRRMEKSELISSYWQDSTIGGRRHYYHIKEKGLEKLAKSNINWSEEKQFVKKLFDDENNSSSVNSSIKEINENVKEAKQKIKQLKENTKNVEEFIKVTEELEKKETTTPSINKVIEKPVKAGNKLILPTINPLQQDIFSALNNKTKEKEPLKTTFTESTFNKEKTNAPIQQDMFNSKTKPQNNYIEQTQKTLVNKEPNIPLLNEEEKEEVKETKNSPTIKHIKSLATQKEFLDIKNSFKNKHKSFLVSATKVTENNYEKTLRRSLSSASIITKEEKPAFKKPFNNLGLEETLKAKELEDKSLKSFALKESLEKNNSTEHKEIVENKQIIENKKEEPSLNLEEDIDYKSILGDLLEETDSPKQKTLKNDLPRVNVADNVNITLKVKPKKPKAEPIYKAENTYTYTYNKPKNNEVLEKPIDNIAITKTEKPQTKELKNFHENLSQDDYSNSLLEDIYLNNITVRKANITKKNILMETNYVSINKLNFNLSLAMFIFMLFEIVGSYIALSNLGYINALTQHKNLFVASGILATTIPVIFSLFYLFNPLRKKEVQYSLLSKISNNFVVLLITLVFIYAVNLFLGMNQLNQTDFIASLVLPIVLSLNLLIYPIIKFVLLKRKKYYL